MGTSRSATYLPGPARVGTPPPRAPAARAGARLAELVEDEQSTVVDVRVPEHLRRLVLGRDDAELVRHAEPLELVEREAPVLVLFRRVHGLEDVKELVEEEEVPEERAKLKRFDEVVVVATARARRVVGPQERRLVVQALEPRVLDDELVDLGQGDQVVPIHVELGPEGLELVGAAPARVERDVLPVLEPSRGAGAHVDPCKAPRRRTQTEALRSWLRGGCGRPRIRATPVQRDRLNRGCRQRAPRARARRAVGRRAGLLRRAATRRIAARTVVRRGTGDGHEQDPRRPGQPHHHPRGDRRRGQSKRSSR